MEGVSSDKSYRHSALFRLLDEDLDGILRILQYCRTRKSREYRIVPNWDGSPKNKCERGENIILYLGQKQLCSVLAVWCAGRENAWRF